MARAGLSASQAQRLGQVQQHLQAGRVAEALELAQGVAAQAPAAPDAQHLLALCLAQLDRPSEAEPAFRAALAVAPRHPMILSNFARMLRRIGRPLEAVACLRDAVAASPGQAALWIDLGLAAREAGDLSTARAALERAVQLQPGHATGWHALGNVCRAAGDLDAAEPALRRAQSLAPGSVPVLVNLGATLRLQGRAGEALACYDAARGAGYDGADLHDARVGALLDLGRSEDALAAARDLVRREPAYAPGHATLAHLLWEQGGHLAPGEDALAGLRAAAGAQPGNRALQLELLRFLLAARHEAEALECLRALPDANDDPTLLALQADALDRLGRMEAAEPIYRRLLDRDAGRDPALVNAYARHLFRAGRWHDVVAQAEAALRLDPDSQEAWAYLGTAWRMLGDAREHWLCDYERLAALVDIEPPPGYASLSAFLEVLDHTLTALHRGSHEPVLQSLRGGSQTPGRLFGRPDPVLAQAETALRAAVERHLATLPRDPTHPFLRRRARSVRIVGSWSVRLWSSGRHVNHIHPEGWMSSAFYVSLPPSVRAPQDDTQAGFLQLGQPLQELGLDLPPRRVLRPEPGKLALFPSYLWHGTVPFHDDAPRLTIAFDMQPRA